MMHDLISATWTASNQLRGAQGEAVVFPFLGSEKKPFDPSKMELTRCTFYPALALLAR
jgi:hypothetical protein